jgi:Kef-type K+ transport system membrane component KefB
MYQRGNLWYADYYDATGHRVRKSFPTPQLARANGMAWREATVLGVLMNTRGLVELVILNIGLDLGVISPALFSMMMLMALVTTFMTTPLLQWLYPAIREQHWRAAA